jgi:zinc protease
MQTHAPISRRIACLSLAACLSPALLRADIDRTHAPAPGLAPAASFPDYQQRTLANGLKVFIVESRREPTVTFRLLIKSGDALDGNKPGLSDTVASLLNKGTAKRTAEQFAKETDFIGASVEASSGPDALSVSASGLTKHLPQVLDLLTDAALHPTFPDEELAKQQKQAISSLVDQKQRPPVIAAKLRGKLLYGENPYGAYPTEESLSAITAADLRAFHKAHFFPDNATLAIVGDVRAVEVSPQIEKAFADWKSPVEEAAKPPSFPPLPSPPKSITIHLVDRPGSVQSDVSVARHGVPRNNPDAPEMGVMNSILGGGLTGRLFQNLRERHGYTYGSNSAFGMNRFAGVFTASAQVRNEVTLPAIQEILGEIKRLRDEPVPAPELSLQRDYLAGNYLLSLESPEHTAARVQEIDLYGLPPDYFKTYASRISKVSAEQIKTLADKYLGADDATIVVVGEAGEVKPQLEKLGPVIVYDTDLKAKAE